MAYQFLNSRLIRVRKAEYYSAVLMDRPCKTDTSLLHLILQNKGFLGGYLDLHIPLRYRRLGVGREIGGVALITPKEILKIVLVFYA